MSDTPEQTLTSQAPEAPSTAPPAQTSGVPNLRSIMESVGTGSAEQPAPSSPTSTSPAPVAAQVSAATASIREGLAKRGFTISDDISSDDAALDTIAELIDAANQVREDQGFQEFQKSRNEFDQWRRSRMSAGQTASTSTVDAPSTTPETKPAVKGLSQEARLLQQHGLISKQANGTWASSNPQFQAAADEVNAFEAKTRNASLRFVTEIAEYDSPEDWVAAVIKKQLASGQVPQSADLQELHELKKELAAEKNRKREAEVSGWVDANASKLFVNGDKSKLSNYGQLYQHYEQAAPADVQSDALARHQWVLKLMAPVESLLTHPQQQATAPEPPPTRPSFLGSAAARSNGAVNRLTSFQGPAAAEGAPPPVLGKGKMPSFAGYMALNGANVSQ
jgi:hypothetical protein